MLILLTQPSSLVFVNMAGILIIVIAGLVVTRPLATGSFVVSTNVNTDSVRAQTSLSNAIVLRVLQWLWFLE